MLCLLRVDEGSGEGENGIICWTVPKPALRVISSSQQLLKASEGVRVADSGVHGESVTAGNTLPGGGMTCLNPLAIDSDLLDMERSWMWKALGRGSRGTTAYSVQRSAGSRQNLVMRTGLRRGSG